MGAIHEDTVERPAPSSADDSALARYLRDMDEASEPMTAEEEALLARRLLDAQAAIWTELGCLPQLVERALRVRPDDLELRALRAARGPARRRLARKSARLLSRRDRDRVLQRELLADLARHGRSAALERCLAARARASAARREFVVRNLRLVVAVARRYAGSGTPFIDLIQDGNLGLLSAVDRFDGERGFRFSTYATWWIRHAIRRGLCDGGHLVRLPAHVLETRGRVARERRRWATTTGRSPTLRELARATGISEARVERALWRERRASLDEPRNDDDQTTMHDTLADPGADELSAPRLLARRETLRHLEDALGALKPIEAAVVRRRFGFDDEEEMPTLSELGREHGLSHERIRQIQEEALKKIRRALVRSDGPPPSATDARPRPRARARRGPRRLRAAAP